VFLRFFVLELNGQTNRRAGSGLGPIKNDNDNRTEHPAHNDAIWRN